MCYVCLYVGLRQEPRHHLPESGPEQRQEDSGDGDVVTWEGLSGDFAATKDGQSAGNVSHGHLIALQTHS
jgi:hypothetical protein